MFNMYSYPDSNETKTSAATLNEYTFAYMQFGLDYKDAGEMAMFDLTADMLIKSNGFGINYDKINVVQ